MYMVSEGIAPFTKLKDAARILDHYANSRLDETNIFEKIEKRNIDELLVKFWQIMEPFEDVKIVEKNTDLLQEQIVTETVEELKTSNTSS